MSVLQLEDRALAELLSHWPTPGGLEGVTVEILESAFLPDRPHALELVHQMAALGAGIAVDDYGSGYSNLKLLESLSPDFLKLDRSFLTMNRDAAAREALIRSAVVIAGIVGAKVIAEGVENEDELRLLESVGVDMVQGFLIADAMPVEELQEWLSRHPD
jgi:EAL domain-containing protein (putative c-di-GMP-specific phosphodiesterase class I)